MIHTVEEGYALHQQGRLAEAERIYIAVLQREPRNFNALHFLGVLALQAGQPQHGVEWIGKAIAIDPRYPPAYNSLARGLHALGRHADSVAAYDRALFLKPDYAVVYSNRVLPLLDLKHFAEALASAERAIALKADYAEAHNHRGLALKELKRFDEAAESFAHAIALIPDFEEAWSNQGVVLGALKRHDEALICHDKALAIRPEGAEFHSNRAATLKDLLRGQDALDSYDRAIALKPEFAPFHANRGSALTDLSRHAEALDSFDRAIALRPDYVEAWLYRGNTLKDLGRFDEAAASYEKSVTIDPGFAEGHWSRSLLHLLRGEFAQGWPMYEWRFKERIILRAHRQPRWNGEDIAGKTLLVECEQGLGDMIQFARYAPYLAGKGIRVLLSTVPALMRLFKDIGPSITIIDSTTEPPAFDYHVPLMSLPLVLGGAWPADTPYLRAEPERVAEWQSRIGAAGLKIGVAWQGAATDRKRSFPLKALQGLAARPGVRLIALQKGDGREQLQDLPAGMRVENPGEDFDTGPDAFIDTTALMENLDLVITLDSAVAHLAGALGRPAFVALKHVPDWRWRLMAAGSPWYPSLTLFRQPAGGDWDSLFAAMEMALADRMGKIS